MILIDTDILIAHLRGIPEARTWLRTQAAAEDLAISVLTITEIIGGMRSHERPEVRALLSALPAIPVTDLVARRAGELQRTYRRSHQGISTPDYLIAATAETMGARLATLNVKHYPMIAGLEAPFTV